MGKLVAGVLVVIAIIVAYSFSAYNTGVRMEANITALNKKSESHLSNYSSKIAEMAQVPAKYVDDLKEVIKANFEGRYGPDGSKATMQWFKENNITIDSKLYLNIQNAISSGRDEFRISQERLQNECANYEALVNSAPRGWIIGMFGLPRLKEGACDVVSDEKTQEVFNSHKQEPLKVF